MSKKPSSVHYNEYLDLDKILDAQHPLSKGNNNEAHEEMLFIIIHAFLASSSLSALVISLKK